MRRSNGRDFLRNPFGWIAFFFFLLAALPAVSDTVVLGSTVYVFSPGQMPAEPTYTLAVQGVSLHPETLEPVVQPCVAGAVFGIYARSGGDFVPFPDFADPSRPLLLVSQPTPLAVFLPRSTDLYIKQESAPAGYVIGEHEGEYLPLTQPGDLTFTNLWSGMQALRVTFTGNGANGAVPLAGVRFHLIGRGQTIPLETDEAGVALALASEPGEYTLAQAEPPDGYRMEPPVTVLLSPGAVTDVSVSNNQNGFLSLRTLGMAVDGQKLTRLVAIDRRYEVLDGNGVACGTLSSGETLALPASPEGIRYTLRPAGIAEDGFAPDTETNEFSVYPGQTTEYQTIAASEMGFFTLSHVSGDDGASVPGGAFAVLDSRGDTVLAFEADSNGAYTPPAPLKAGHYVLTMTRAGEGHLYDGHIAPFTISPYLAADSPIAEVTYVSQPLPAGLLSPQITAMSQACNSLFLSDAEVDFTLTLTQNWRDLPIKGLTFDLHAPEIAGAAWLGERPDGGRLYIPRRFALAGVEEVHALSVSGIARYSFEYPVAPDTLAQKNITAPFDVTVATFTPLASPAAYAVSGHVTDAAGKSLSGLPVTLEDESGAPLAQTVTDPYGAYAFSYKPDGAVVRFHPADGYGALPNGQDARILPLETVQGHVLVHGPLDGYPVTLSIAGLDPQAPDRDGRFVFTGMLLSKEALSVQTPEGVLWRIEGGPPESIIHLYPAASLLGRALDPQGKPIAGAEIVLTGAERTYAAYSRGDGSYQIGELYPGAYEIAFTPPKGLILNGEHMQTIELLAGERRTLDVRMMEPGVIEGMITADNAPLVGVPVLLEPVGLAVITDERGRFTLTPLSADTYTLGVALPEGMVFIEPPEPVTLSQSGERVSFDLAAVYPVTLTGLVWHDLNDDGLRSTDEPGLEGITVTLLSTEQTPAAAAQTGQNGTYTFTDLLPGTYRIGVALPENMIFAKSAPEVTRLLAGIDSNTAISGPITLRSGDRPDLLVCGGTHTARLSGFVWEDVSVTGAYREGTDPLLAGIAVTLIKEGAVRRETLTDEKGAYAFAGLRTGEYTLRMTLPDGYLFAENSYAEGTKSDMPAILGRTAEREVSLAAWQAEAAVNAGVMKAAALSGLVWIDTEADGTQWNSKGYSGLAISLYALSGARETLVAERETDETGAYAFEGLRPGQYRLAYRLPEAGWGFTVGSASEVFSLGNGERLETKAAVSKLGCICGLVFADTNYDGYRGEEDPGLTATVSLVDPFTGTILRQAQAGKDGAYAFDSLFAGRYIVRFTLKEGYYFTRNQDDAPSFSSNVRETAGSTADTATLYLPMGETILVDAGAYQTGVIAGDVWQDLANSGAFSQGDPPLHSLSVTLLRDGAAYRTTETDDAGHFLFSALPPGNYTLRVTLPDTMRFTFPQAPGLKRASTIAATGETVGETEAFLLPMGARLTEFDVGAVALGAIRGAVQSALDGAPLPGVSILLLRNGQTEATLFTDEKGIYQMKALRPGPMEVAFILPQGWVIKPDAGASFAVEIPQGADAAPDAITLMPECVVAGMFWVDGDGDRLRGEREAPLTGVSVTLVLHEAEEAREIASKTMEADGSFRFDGLAPGTYSLRLPHPEGVYCYASEETDPFALAMGDTHTAEFGAYIGASLSGFVWEDMNNNGLFEKDEPLLEGVTVTLLDGSGGLEETLTDENGAYRFDALPPMEGTLRFSLPGDYLPGACAPESIHLPMGSEYVGINACAVRCGRIGDLVWLDENGNGLQETNEPGVPDIKVTLYSVLSGGDLFYAAETVTDAHGHYRFDRVAPGQYQLAFGLGDYLPTKPTAILPQINSKMPWTGKKAATTASFYVSSGERRLMMDVGLVTPQMFEAFGWKMDGEFNIFE